MTSILSNVTAMSASRQLGITSSGMQQTIERLTTGKRINRASDDAAGLDRGGRVRCRGRAANQNVQTDNNTFFAAQAGDGYLAEATTQVQRWWNWTRVATVGLLKRLRSSERCQCHQQGPGCSRCPRHRLELPP